MKKINYFITICILFLLIPIVTARNTNIIPALNGYVFDNADANHVYNSSSLCTGYTSGGETGRVYATFNLSPILNDPHFLYIQNMNLTVIGIAGGSGGARNMGVHLVNNTGWSESTLTWNNQPCGNTLNTLNTTCNNGTVDSFSFSISSNDQFLYANVTALKSFYNPSDKKLTIIIEQDLNNSIYENSYRCFWNGKYHGTDQLWIDVKWASNDTVYLNVNTNNQQCGMFIPPINNHSYIIGSNISVTLYPFCQFLYWKKSAVNMTDNFINITSFNLIMDNNYTISAVFNITGSINGVDVQNSTYGGGIALPVSTPLGNLSWLNMFFSGYSVLALVNIGLAGFVVIETRKMPYSFELGLATFLAFFLIFLFAGFYPAELWVIVIFGVAMVSTLLLRKIGMGK